MSSTVAAQTGHSQFCLLSFRDLSPRLDAPAISMAKSRNGLTAVGLSVLGAFLVLLAFTTKSWVVTDGKLEHPKFERIGQYNIIISHTCARALHSGHAPIIRVARVIITPSGDEHHHTGYAQIGFFRQSFSDTFYLNLF